MFGFKSIFVRQYPFFIFLNLERDKEYFVLIKKEISNFISFLIILSIFSLEVLRLVPDNFFLNEYWIFWSKILVLVLLFIFYLFFSIKYNEKKLWIKYFPLFIYFLFKISFVLIEEIFSQPFIINKVQNNIKNKDFFINLPNILQFFLFLFGTIIFWTFNNEYREKTIKRIKENPKSFLFFSFFIIILLLFLYKNFFFNYTESDIEIKSSQNEENLKTSLQSKNIFVKLITLFSIFLIAPLWEEIFYRYFVYIMVGRNSVFLFLLISCFLFSIAHMQTQEFENVENFLDVIKILFSKNFFAYWRDSVFLGLFFLITSGDLIYNHILHFSMNFLTFLNLGYLIYL